MWHQITQRGPATVVAFESNPPQPWVPGILHQPPLLKESLRGKIVLLEGKAPVWMYAHAAAFAAKAGAKEISVAQPQSESPIRVFPVEPDSDAESCWFDAEPDGTGATVVRFLAATAGGTWQPQRTIGALPGASASWSPDLVTLTGKGANWMYAAAACAATARGSMVASFSPKDPHAILLNADPGQDISIPPSPALASAEKTGRVIGIVGDPNSGKSVLAALLEFGFEAAGLKPVWRLDCDYQAPTSHWYLEMLSGGRAGEASDIRERQKRTWSAGAERMLADQLEYCSRSLAWTIADLPGGIHKPDLIARIPPGREVLFAPVDGFLIVVRADRPEAEAAWSQDLAGHGFADRILGVVFSSNPGLPLRLATLGGESLRAEAQGLDRRHLDSDSVGKTIEDWKDFAHEVVRSVQLNFRAL